MAKSRKSSAAVRLARPHAKTVLYCTRLTRAQSWTRMLAKRRALRETIAAAIVVRRSVAGVRRGTASGPSKRRSSCRRRAAAFRGEEVRRPEGGALSASGGPAYHRDASFGRAQGRGHAASLRLRARRGFSRSSTPSPRSRPGGAVDRYVNATPRSGQAP